MSSLPCAPPSPLIVRGHRNWSLLALAGLLSSCIPIERPYPPPTAKAIVSGLQSQAQHVRTLRAEARMTHDIRGDRARATLRMMAARPDRLRFDLVSPFDTPLITLVARDGRFAMIDARANRHLYGPATPCNLARVIGVALRPEDIVTVLAGSTPVIAHDHPQLRWDAQNGREVLELAGDTLREVIELGGKPQRWELASSRLLDRAGQTLLLLRADDYRPVAGLRLPYTLVVSQPKRHSTLELAFARREVNIELPRQAFELPQAGRLPSEHVTCDEELAAAGQHTDHNH